MDVLDPQLLKRAGLIAVFVAGVWIIATRDSALPTHDPDTQYANVLESVSASTTDLTK